MSPISIHALLAESDNVACGDRHQLRDFYPRSPCGERPRRHQKQDGVFGISIHALLAESDRAESDQRHSPDNFYPRSPCGERRVTVLGIQHRTGISIHALLAESDPRPRYYSMGGHISIHALLAESDGARHTGQQNTVYFYPRSPCGERRNRPTTKNTHTTYFYPRSPCGERRPVVLLGVKSTSISIHALLAESDNPRKMIVSQVRISIHALLAESDFNQLTRPT